MLLYFLSMQKNFYLTSGAIKAEIYYTRKVRPNSISFPHTSIDWQGVKQNRELWKKYVAFKIYILKLNTLKKTHFLTNQSNVNFNVFQKNHLFVQILFYWFCKYTFLLQQNSVALPPLILCQLNILFENWYLFHFMYLRTSKKILPLYPSKKLIN